MVPTGHGGRWPEKGVGSAPFWAYRHRHGKHKSNPSGLVRCDPVGTHLGTYLRPVSLACRAPRLARPTLRAACRRAGADARYRQWDRTEPAPLSTTARAARARRARSGDARTSRATRNALEAAGI